MTMGSIGTGAEAGLSQIQHLASCVIETHDDAELSLVSDWLRQHLESIPKDKREQHLINVIGQNDYNALKEKFEP